MKKLILLTTFLFAIIMVNAQTTEMKYYDPNADAMKDVKEAVAKAKESNKHVLLQIGGNWCKWCRLYDKWSHETPMIDSLLKADYVVVHVNYSPENKNSELMKELEYPQRFGFPVIVILDKKGIRLHTQNSGYLEQGEGYNEKKVEEFLQSWNVNAFDEVNYK